jgi:hypothetical protein
VTALNGPGISVGPICRPAQPTAPSSVRRECRSTAWTAAGDHAEDERAHGLDERMAVRALYDNVVFWELVLKALASR